MSPKSLSAENRNSSGDSGVGVGVGLGVGVGVGLGVGVGVGVGLGVGVGVGVWIEVFAGVDLADRLVSDSLDEDPSTSTRKSTIRACCHRFKSKNLAQIDFIKSKYLSSNLRT